MRTSAAAVIASAIITLPASAGFTPYANTFRTVAAPPIAASSFGVAGAALADGRLIAMTGSEFFIESAVGTGLFELAATLDASITAGTDPGFISVSADGSSIALGAGFGRPVVTFASSLLNSATPTTISTANAGVFSIDHFAGTWQDSTTLVVTGQAGVTAINTITGDTTVLVSNVGGASAGVAFDSAGNLYTGNGFDFNAGAGSVTGTIRAFAPADWAAGTADFETAGSFIAEILSASPMHFDAAGNLIVAGGDFSGADAGYVGVFNMTTGQLAQYDPAGTGSEFYSAFVNSATGELVVQNGSDWFIYAVPAPGALALAPLGFTAILGRRRRAA